MRLFAACRPWRQDEVLYHNILHQLRDDDHISDRRLSHINLYSRAGSIIRQQDSASDGTAFACMLFEYEANVYARRTQVIRHRAIGGI